MRQYLQIIHKFIFYVITIFALLKIILDKHIFLWYTLTTTNGMRGFATPSHIHKAIRLSSIELEKSGSRNRPPLLSEGGLFLIVSQCNVNRNDATENFSSKNNQRPGAYNGADYFFS